MTVGVEAIGSDREIAESELTVTKGVQKGLLLPEHSGEAVSEIDIGHEQLSDVLLGSHVSLMENHGGEGVEGVGAEG